MRQPLLLQQTPTLTPAQLQAKIESFVVDQGAAGKDNIYGSGRVLLPSLPVNTVAPASPVTAARRTGAHRQHGDVDGLTGPDDHAPVETVQQLRRELHRHPFCDGATYTLVAADAGSTIRLRVTGTNTGGSVVVETPQTVVVDQTPANTALPTVTGLTQVGALLTATPGTWTGFPAPTLTYQWQRCNSGGSSCADIPLATASTYTAVQADAGGTLRVGVTGTNVVTTVTAFSVVTSLITVPPANTLLPSVTGTAAVGTQLTGNNGTWTGSPVPTLTDQWLRCDTSGNSCVNIGGATSINYTPVQADAGTTLRLKVTGTSTSGTDLRTVGTDGDRHRPAGEHGAAGYHRHQPAWARR